MFLLLTLTTVTVTSTYIVTFIRRITPGLFKQKNIKLYNTNMYMCLGRTECIKIKLADRVQYN